MARRKTIVPLVVDTNVCVVSNRREGDPIEWASKCANQLHLITKSGILVIDSQDVIFSEYKRYLSFRGEPGAGDRFFKWLVDNRYREDRVHLTTVTFDEDRPGNFEEFPEDPELVTFHLKDRVFVAVALSHPQTPAIVNAVDSDYWHHRVALVRNGVTILNICGTEHFKPAEQAGRGIT